MFIDKRRDKTERKEETKYRYHNVRLSFRTAEDKATFQNYIKSQKLKYGGSESDIVLKLIQERWV